MALTGVLLYIVIALVTVLVYFIRKNLNYFKDRGIPHDKPHILYGNMQGFRKTHVLQDFHQKIYKKYKGTGPYCGFYFLHKPCIFVLDTDLAKHILIKDFTNFANRGVFYNERDDPLSAHLFALDGIKWKQLRQKLSPTFTSGKMKFMFPTVTRVGEQFVEVLGEMVENGNVIEIREMLARFTTDVIGTCAFGIDCNSLKDPNAEFRVMGRRSFEKERHNGLVMTFIHSFPALARKLRMRMIPEDVHQFFLRIVRETVELREKKNVKRNDFMDMLVELKNKKSVKLENGEILSGLTVEEVAAQAFVFFLAGFETSSTTMGYALYELAQHQDVQDRLRQEFNDALAKHNDELTYECSKELHYMDQVISEILRLYTIVPHLNRQAINDYEIPGYPNYKIERNSDILIPSSAYHHDPEFYPEPSVFNPDRFSPEMVAKRDSVEWLPFGDGPRNCIGLRFGKMQTRVGLGLLLKHFRFSVCEQTKIPMEFDPKMFVLAAKGGIYLNIEKV